MIFPIQEIEEEDGYMYFVENIDFKDDYVCIGNSKKFLLDLKCPTRQPLLDAKAERG